MSRETIVIVIDVIIMGLAIYGAFYGVRRERWFIVGLCSLLLVWQAFAFLSSVLSSSLAAGVAAYQRGDYGTAVSIFRKQADAGNPDAQFQLGVMYANGQGVPQDHVEAVKWMRKAAEQGFVMALANLAASYVTGQGVSQDYVRAYAWSNAAALGGHEESGGLRDAIVGELSPAQLDEAGRLSEEIIHKHRTE